MQRAAGGGEVGVANGGGREIWLEECVVGGASKVGGEWGPTALFGVR